MDIDSRKVVGWEVHEQELADLAAGLVRRACLAEGITRPGLVLHADNGAPMKGATLQQLGVVPSFSRPSVSNDNPYSESLFRTLKYTPAWPGKPFESLEAARAWVQEFVTWYNGVHNMRYSCDCPGALRNEARRGPPRPLTDPLPEKGQMVRCPCFSSIRLNII